MRTWSVFLLLLATSVSGCFDDLPQTDVPDGPDAPPAAIGIFGGTLYLHGDDDLWMDEDADATDTALAGSVTAATGGDVYRFPLRPEPEADVVHDGPLTLSLDLRVNGAVGSFPYVEGRLLVDGDEAGTFSGTATGFQVDSPTWPAGAPVVLEVCVCDGPGVVAYDYELRTDGGSTLTIPATGSGGGGGGSAGGSSSSGVSTYQQNGRWVAERTVTHDDAVAQTADVSLRTVNGAVEVTRGGTQSHLEARLRGYGDTEQQARDRLAALSVDHDASTLAGTFTLDVEARSSAGWTNRSADLSLNLADVDLADLLAETVNGAVSVQGHEGGDWRLATTNGAVTATGFTVDSVTATSSNGLITLDGTADDVQAETSNGQVEADLRAAASGSWDFSASNGQLLLEATESAQRGYDVQASTVNGGITFDFQDTQPVGEQTSKNKHERTNGYATRSIQTSVTMETVNGAITAEGSA